MKTEIITIEKRVKPLLTKANELSKIYESNIVDVTELLSQAGSLLKDIKEEHKKSAEPFETPLKELNMHYKPTEKALEALIDDIRLKVGRYQTDIVNALEEKQRAITGRIGGGKGKIGIETAVERIEKLNKPLEKIVTTSGSLSFRSKDIVKIIDASKIPREYLIPDEEKIYRDLHDGQMISGATLMTIQIPVNKN